MSQCYNSATRKHGKEVSRPRYNPHYLFVLVQSKRRDRFSFPLGFGEGKYKATASMLLFYRASETINGIILE